jgi:hypothetical protein
MPILLLHEANLNSAKSALRARLPNVRSSHLTEALAAAAGFRTHAALLRCLVSDPSRSTPIADIAENTFDRRLGDFGYESLPRRFLTSVVRSDRIPDRPFVEFPKGDWASNKAHFYACRQLNRPMIMVRTSQRYATLEWDCITMDPKHDAHRSGNDDGGTAMRALFGQFQTRAKGAPGKPEFFGSAFTGTVKRLLPEIARDLAEDYFRMLLPSNGRAAGQ